MNRRLPGGGPARSASALECVRQTAGHADPRGSNSNRSDSDSDSNSNRTSNSTSNSNSNSNSSSNNDACARRGYADPRATAVGCGQMGSTLMGPRQK